MSALSRKKSAHPDSGVPATPEYRQFIEGLKSRVESARISAARAVNSELIQLYWDIGCGIVEKQRTLGWGESVLEMVAADLRRAFPNVKGFSPQNVWRMRQFYLIHNQEVFLSQVVRELKKADREAPADLSQVVRDLVSAVPWGHHANILAKISEPAPRRPSDESCVHSPRRGNALDRGTVCLYMLLYEDDD